MTATNSTVAPPRQRWHQSRKLRYGVVLLGIGIAAYLALPWLLMPADLRRMQGTWKIVRVVSAGEEDQEDPELGRVIVVVGNRIGSHDGRSMLFEVRPEQKTLVNYEPDSVTVFGLEFHVPIWLRRPASLRHPVPTLVSNYEFNGPDLILRHCIQPEGGDPTEIHLVRVR
jgi:hypothetical protein